MQVQEAIQALGGRVTVGDVAARAGVRVSEAESALNALAADCNASIQVRLVVILNPQISSPGTCYRGPITKLRDRRWFVVKYKRDPVSFTRTQKPHDAEDRLQPYQYHVQLQCL
jgi:hypothetical protein